MGSARITQSVVVINRHMCPIDMKGFGKFTSVYHLRLLSVSYMTGDTMPEYIAREELVSTGDDNDQDLSSSEDQGEDDALEAAMSHAHEIGVHQGVTRAMVIRAYPRPWHVFVDTSPDSDADFEVAATFDVEPTQDDVNYAIVECLEGSEREDEIVAQQMQSALEAGQLNRVGDMLGISSPELGMVTGGNLSEDPSDISAGKEYPYREYDSDDFYDDWFNVDST